MKSFTAFMTNFIFFVMNFERFFEELDKCTKVTNF